MWILTLNLAAHADPILSPDEAYVVDAEGWEDVGNGRIRRGRDPYRVELRDSQPQQADLLDQADSWFDKWGERHHRINDKTIDLKDGRNAACVIGRRTTLNGYASYGVCVVELGGRTTAVIESTNTDLLRGNANTVQLMDLVHHVHPTQAMSPQPASVVQPGDPSVATEGGAAEEPAPQKLSPAVAYRIAQLTQQGYRCHQGTWNAKGPKNDLRVYFNPSTKEMVTRFQVLDGTETMVFYLGGTVEVQAEGYFGHLDLFEGPKASSSGIHRFFSAQAVQGQAAGDQLESFRTMHDEAFTVLGACDE